MASGGGASRAAIEGWLSNKRATATCPNLSVSELDTHLAAITDPVEHLERSAPRLGRPRGRFQRPPTQPREGGWTPDHNGLESCQIFRSTQELRVLRAYLDESFGPNRTLIAGFVGDHLEWASVRMRWGETLEKWDAPYYHGSEVYAGAGPFRTWQRDRRTRFAADCAEVLASSSLGEIISSFNGNWTTILQEAPHLRSRFPSSYAFAFELAMAQVDRAAEIWFEAHGVECILERQDEHSRHALYSWKRLERAGRHSRIDSVRYEQSDDAIELQCADMLAHETNRGVRCDAALRGQLPLTNALHARRRMLFSGRKQTEETLLRIFARDATLSEIFHPVYGGSAPTPEEHDALVAKYAHLQ